MLLGLLSGRRNERRRAGLLDGPVVALVAVAAQLVRRLAADRRHLQGPEILGGAGRRGPESERRGGEQRARRRGESAT